MYLVRNSGKRLENFYIQLTVWYLNEYMAMVYNDKDDNDKRANRMVCLKI